MLSSVRRTLIYHALLGYLQCVSRITNVWNSLPFSVVTAPSVNSFKNRLDKHWALQELKYDWETELSGTGSTGRVEFRVFRVLPLYILNNDIGTEALRLRP